MNIFQRLSRVIIKASFHFAVWTIEQFHDMSRYEEKVRKLQAMPEGALGKDIATCLKENRLSLVPNYESHDLKHVLLDFKMTPVDEIRMQAFMIGNGNYSVPSFAIFIFGAILLPELWTVFYSDFKRGRKVRPISKWTIDDYAHLQTSTLREMVFDNVPAKQNTFRTKTMAKFGAYTAIIVGTLGMLFCLPFLFSSSVADLIGAGFPFLGGSIIASAGLVALSNLAKNGHLLNSKVY